ncbi:MAG: transporter substrate-binding domain-containing protein [Nitrospiraceae bacterium]|nr:transporter substrate-binding domain-containing protein [Nitrospiraceae bacterium]
MQCKNRTLNPRLLLRLLAIGIVLCSGSAYGKPLLLNTFNTYPLSSPQGTGYLDLVIKEAFRRIGADVKIVRLSSERGLVNADRGIDDGDFVRIAGLDKTYPNLVRVPAALCDFEFTVFTKDPSIRIEGWQGLKPYNVGIITGWKILERKIVGTRSLTKVGNATALFELLAHDRADLVVFDKVEGDAIIKKLGLSGIIALRPYLARQDMYLYLNRRHAGLARRLAEALLEMKTDGSMRRIARSVAGLKE